MTFVRVASVSEVPPGPGKLVLVGGKKLGLFNVDGTIHAIDDTCPHRGASLCEGEVDGTRVTCPWHDASFDLATGAHLSPPVRTGVAVYRVQVVGDEVQVDLA